MRSRKLFLIPSGSATTQVVRKQRTLGGKLLKKMLKHRLALVLIAHGLVIAVLGYGAIYGSDEPQALNSLANQIVAVDDNVAAVDQVSSAEMAGQIAKLTSIVEANSVVNQADSLNVQVDFGNGTSTYLAKPQLIDGGAKTKKDIITYKTAAEDTVSGLAAKFGISADTIRWANNLQGEIIGEGRDVTIPPVTGVLYTVAEGDTPDSLASKYKADKEAIIKFNDAETTGLVMGEKIIIPDGVVPAPVVKPAVTKTYTAPGSTYVAPTATAPASTIANVGSASGFNGYAIGYCTWHAANRRIQIGHPVPPFMGNAITWVSAAQASGIPVGDTPVAGAIVWHRYQGGLGHVAFLEQVYPDGSMLISDMNYNFNWNRVTYRTEPASNARLYKFIY